MMVAAGFGVCFLPEFSTTIPGVRTQLVMDPEVVRDVSLVSMSGRRFSPAVLALVRAIRAHDWSRDNGAGARDHSAAMARSGASGAARAASEPAASNSATRPVQPV